MARTILRWALPLVIVALQIYPLVRRLHSTESATFAAASNPDTADEQLNRSLQAYQRGNYQEAILDAQAALRTRPDFAAAYNNLAVSYLQLKMFDEALRNSREAVRLQPDFQLAKNNLMWIEQEMAKSTTAPARRGTADSYLDQSVQAYEAGRFQESIDAARQALKLDSSLAAAYSNIGASYASMKKWDLAIENERKALELKPDFQLARNNLDWALKGKAGTLAVSSTRP